MQATERETSRHRGRVIVGAVLAIGLASACATFFMSGARTVDDSVVQATVVERPVPEAEPSPPAPAPALTVASISTELRRKGYNECNPHDPMGLGPYRAYVPLTTGRALIPQEGGMSEDHGFDVLIHFHGHRAARINLVQVSRGTTFVGSDFGVGSHAYSEAFATWRRFPLLLRSLTNALKRASGHDDAHIRHLTLSAWSAGYGAINEILKLHGDKQVDAVVLLDGLYASWNPQARRKKGVDAVLMRKIRPILSFAEKALRGDKVFVLTHSEVNTSLYVSTKLTADRLLSDMGVKRTAVDSGEEPFGKTGTVDIRGLHIWSYRGTREMAHCSHLRHLATIVGDVIEPAFGTPSMNRDVPYTKAPPFVIPVKTKPDTAVSDSI